MAGRRDHVAANSQPDCGQRAQVLANPNHNAQVASEARLSCDLLPPVDKFGLLRYFRDCRAQVIAWTGGNAHEWTVLNPQPAARDHIDSPNPFNCSARVAPAQQILSLKALLKK